MVRSWHQVTVFSLAVSRRQAVYHSSTTCLTSWEVIHLRSKRPRKLFPPTTFAGSPSVKKRLVVGWASTRTFSSVCYGKGGQAPREVSIGSIARSEICTDARVWEIYGWE